MSNTLKQAITAARSGQNSRARRLLIHVLRADPENTVAWLWLAYATEGERRRQALKQVLALDPDNEVARAELERMQYLPVQVSPTEAIELHETTECPYCFSEVDSRATVCPECQRELPGRQKKKRTGRGLMVGVLAFLCIGLAALYFLGSGSDSCRAYYNEVSRVKAEEWDDPDINAYYTEDPVALRPLVTELREGRAALQRVDVADCGRTAHTALLEYTRATIKAHATYLQNGNTRERERLLEEADQHFEVWAREYQKLNCQYNAALDCN